MSCPLDPRFRWLPRIGWFDLQPQEAVELGLEQAMRWRWQAFGVDWLGYSMFFMGRAFPQ